MKQRYFLTCLTVFLFFNAVAQNAVDYTLQLSAITQTSPLQIKISWKKVGGLSGYTISKKAKEAATWTVLTNLTISDSFYTDNAVIADSAYEYQVQGYGGTAPTGFIYAGISSPAIHTRGGLVLMVDSMFKDSCNAEIRQLMNDLSGDGWQIFRHDVTRSMAVTQIKSLIVTDYQSHSNLKAVVLLGHIPVPYSGDLNPDGHPDHQGAWPADAYYGDIDGNWTDMVVNDTTASRLENRNKPGDGKFDQTVIPSAVELQLGRIDFANMPAFNKTEFKMMRSYLNRAHAYKMDSLTIVHRGLVDDNFGGFGGEAFAANGWRDFAPLVGPDSTKQLPYIATLNASSYQWSYGCGGGSYTSAGGIGSTTDFVNKQVNSIFSMLFGSYFGDWDATNDFLRAPLCADVPALTNCWAGRPNWFMHHMALGENIGYSTRLTQNNGPYTPTNYGNNYVHVALMGDPSLRTDYIKPIPTIVITPHTNAGATLSWISSPDAAVIGYYVYRSDTLFGKYAPISTLLTLNSFNDLVGVNGKKYYQVRPVKLQQTPSGKYYNTGIGVIDSAAVTYPLSVPEIALDENAFRVYPNPATTVLNASVFCNQRYAGEISVLDITGKEIITKHVQLNAGQNGLSINVEKLALGVYTVQLKINETILTRKLIKG